MPNPERIYIYKLCVVHSSKSKTIPGSTPEYIIIYLSITKGLCALFSHLDYFFIALFADFKLIITFAIIYVHHFIHI
jgi:hypothetical protein